MDDLDDNVLCDLWSQNFILSCIGDSFTVVWNKSPDFEPTVLAGTEENPLVFGVLLNADNGLAMLIIAFAKSFDALVKVTAIFDVENQLFIVGILKLAIIIHMHRAILLPQNNEVLVFLKSEKLDRS